MERYVLDLNKPWPKVAILIMKDKLNHCFWRHIFWYFFCIPLDLGVSDITVLSYEDKNFLFINSRKVMDRERKVKEMCAYYV